MFQMDKRIKSYLPEWHKRVTWLDNEQETYHLARSCQGCGHQRSGWKCWLASCQSELILQAITMFSRVDHLVLTTYVKPARWPETILCFKDFVEINSSFQWLGCSRPHNQVLYVCYLDFIPVVAAAKWEQWYGKKFWCCWKSTFSICSVLPSGWVGFRAEGYVPNGGWWWVEVCAERCYFLNLAVKPVVCPAGFHNAGRE